MTPVNKILIHFLGIFLILSSIAESSLTENDYLKIAKNYLFYLKSNKTIVSVEHIVNNKILIGRIMHLKDGGYLLIPEKKRLPPIKLYSLKNDYETLPQAFKQFIIQELTSYQRKTTSNFSRISSENSDKWDFLLNYSSKTTKNRNYVPDTYLLKTTWNQNYPYNKLLPQIDGVHVLAGCTQAAQAQIMKYHQHPERGNGIATHTWNNQEFEAILYKSYHWENMPDTLDNSTPEYFQDEVALLYRDLIIANKATMGLSATSASMNVNAMAEYFGYGTDIKQMTNENENDFFSVIRNEIDHNRPVLLSLPNHSTVADGYASDVTGKKIHINMGWGGHSDDFYYLNETIETDSYIFPTSSLTIKYNIKPCSSEENNCFEHLEILESNDRQDGLSISGIFDSENDIDSYSEYLKGTSQITGDRGYLNQAFYIMVYNSKNEPVISSDETIQYDFPTDYYKIKISLKNEYGGGYTYGDENYLNYDVLISTQLITENDIDMIQNQDSPPSINTEFKDIIMSKNSSYGIRIDAVDKDGDNVNLIAISSNAVVETTIEKDILTVQSKSDVGYARIYVIASSKAESVQKTFAVLINDEAFGWGEEFTVQGTFDSQSDYNQHKVLLDGQCQIKGDNGYSNQAFYTSVLDNSQNTIVSMNDEMINQPFNKSIYFIGASLNMNPDGYGSFYEYDANNPGYSLFVNCPNATWSLEEIADVLKIEISNESIFSLKQCITILQLLSGYSLSNSVNDIISIQGNKIIGIEDVLYILHYISGIEVID